MTQHDLNRLEAEIARSARGIGRLALEKRLGLSRATAIRYLAELLRQGRIVAEGQARARIYRVAAARGTDSSDSGKTPDYVPLSGAGAEIRGLVSRPVSARTPVGYHVEFLDRYRPNRTKYLSRDEIEHLHRLGRTNVNERPAGTYARDILGRLLVDLSWASSRLEGNTYTLLDTQRLIEFGKEAEGKDAAEAQMILNHKRAIELLVDEADEIGFNRYTLLNMHAILADNLLADPSAAGALRWRPVGIGGTVYSPPEVPQQIGHCFDVLLQKAAAIAEPFEQAFFVMVHLPYLQPFEDVNKRVSRLAANIPLIRANLCPLSFVDVPARAYTDAIIGVYELNRVELLRDVFVWAYERSSRRYPIIKESLHGPDPFRLKHRAALGSVIQRMVREMRAPQKTAVRSLARSQVPPADMDRFVALVIDELQRLHEGNIARYGIRPSELGAWKSRG